MDSNKPLYAALAVCAGLVGVAVVGGVTGEGPEGGPAKPIVLERGYRPAVFAGRCPDTARCAAPVIRNGACVCLTKQAPQPNEEATPAASLYYQLKVCQNITRRADIVTVLSRAGTPDPAGYACQTVVASSLIANTYANVQTEVEEALASKCGFPVTPGAWYCCPVCLMFADGCPPCPQLCPYFERWKGHEEECAPTNK